MHTQSIDRWQHAHVFLGKHHEHNERKTWAVIALTTVMMIGEIIGGSIFGSMALIADGWHMSTHVGTLAIAAFAYTYTRRRAHDPRFAFGTGKIGDLAGFTSAIILALISLLIAYQATQRLIAPIPIAFDEAIGVAILGLAVNLASAWLLRDDDPRHRRAQDAAHGDGMTNRHRDHNLRAAYTHVVADAATSVFAIAGLLAGRLYGLIWMDAVVGIIGAGVIANWSYGLMRDSERVLLDMTDGVLAAAIRHKLETGSDRVADLHLWQVGPSHYGAIVSLVSDHPLPPAAYKNILTGIDMLSHVTIEVNPCE